MNEKNMQVLFGKCIKNDFPKETEAYELKFTKENILSFDSVKEHQIEALLAVEGKGLYHRITDQPWLKNIKFSYTLKKPFDCFFLAKAKAYIVIWFYKPRQLKKFIKIRIGDFLKLKESTKRKSLTEEMALGVATEVITIFKV